MPLQITPAPHSIIHAWLLPQFKMFTQFSNKFPKILPLISLYVRIRDECCVHDIKNGKANKVREVFDALANYEQ